MSVETWTVVLAGGQGRRLAAVTGGVPKQFYAPRDGTTLLEDTVRRVWPIAGADRLVTVIDQSHDELASRIAARVSLGRLELQRMDRGTAAGVLLGLSTPPAESRDIVVLTPADHGVGNLRLFRRGLRRAVRAIRRGQADVVLFAVAPSHPSGDFGWVLPVPGGRFRLSGFSAVGSFEEKPRADRAHDLLAAGAAWNTMVLAARVGRLLDLYARHLPGLARVFARARALAVNERAAFLDAQYPSLPTADFSRDLLGSASGLQTYVWPAALGWTDLGTPERLRAWLAREDDGRRDRLTDRAAEPRSRLSRVVYPSGAVPAAGGRATSTTS